MDIDVTALARLLREDPEQRDALRTALLGDEADLYHALGRLAEAQQRTETRVEVLARRLGELAEAQQRTETRVGELAEAQQRTETRVEVLAKRLGELAQAQQRTENAVTALIDVVSGMNDRQAKVDGYLLEQRYRERGHSYFQPIARRLRHLGGAALSTLVDDAHEAGTISAAEIGSLLQADAVFTGRDARTREPVHLVVEASVTVARHDVRRARVRADILARIVSTPVLAVVAGEYAPETVRVAAADAEVWVVTDGRVLDPFDDPDRPA